MMQSIQLKRKPYNNKGKRSFESALFYICIRYFFLRPARNISGLQKKIQENLYKATEAMVITNSTFTKSANHVLLSCLFFAVSKNPENNKGNGSDEKTIISGTVLYHGFCNSRRRAVSCVQGR